MALSDEHDDQSVTILIPLPPPLREAADGESTAAAIPDWYSFAYKLSRNLQHRSNGGRPQALPPFMPSANKDLQVAVVASAEAMNFHRAFPPFIAAAEDAGISFLTWPTVTSRAGTGSKNVLLVITTPDCQCAGCDANVMNAAYVLSLDDGSGPVSSVSGWQPHASSIVVRREHLWLASPSHGTIGDAVRLAFQEATSCCLGPKDQDSIGLMTPRVTKPFQKLVFTGSGDSSDHAGESRDANSSKRRSGIDMDDADSDDVWMQPMESGTVQYAMALLRLSGMSSALLTQLLPLLFDKVAYLRNTHPELLLEVVDAIESSLLTFVPPFVVRVSSEGVRFDAPVEADLAVLEDALRLLFRLSADDIAVRIGALAPRLCGKDCAAAHVIHGRCLEAAGDVSGARRCFAAVVALQDTHVEALLAVRRLDAGAAAIPDIVAQSDGGPIEEIGAHADDDDDDRRQAETVSKKRQDLWERLALRARQRSHESMGFECLETASRLSTSKIYTFTRNFYETKGIDAWSNGTQRSSGTVPFYITSNPYIAVAYVRIILDLLLDYDSRGVIDRSAPIYILELGTGPGKFSSIFLAHLERALSMRRKSALAGLKIVYVMTDFTPSNVDAWGMDPALQPHVDSGLLDFAVFDVDDPLIEIALIRSGVCLSSARPTVNPILVFANYVLDSLGMDAFRVAGGRLQEALVSTYAKSSVSNECADSTSDITFADPSVPGNIRQEWNYADLSSSMDYYTAMHAADYQRVESRGEHEGESAISKSTGASNVAKALDKVLVDYLSLLEDESTFTLPVSGMRAVQTLQSLTRSGCVSMLIADKGLNRATMLSRKGDPIINLHGSLSMMVNLEALERFAKYLAKLQGVGSTTLHTPQQNSSLDICFLNIGLDSAPERASKAFVDSLCIFGVYDLFTVCDHVEDIWTANMRGVAGRSLLPGADGIVETPNMPISLVMAMLRLSGWDPELLLQFGERLVEAVKHDDPAERRYFLHLAQNCHRFMESYTARFDGDGLLLSRYHAIVASLHGSAVASHLAALALSRE